MDRAPMAAPKTTKKPAAKLSDELAEKARARPLPQDPLSALGLRSLGLRLGIPIVIGWIIAFIIPGWIPKVVVGVLTLIVLGLAGWVVRFTQRSRKVAAIVQKADSKEARKDAIAELEQGFKKGDSAAIFAKAQLQMQDDPRGALTTLEQIKLDKVMAPVADEARAQRALIHLMFGELDDARPLADGIDMSQHKDPKQRVMLAAIVGETWARSGQAKKAVDLLGTFDPEDPTYEDLRPAALPRPRLRVRVGQRHEADEGVVAPPVAAQRAVPLGLHHQEEQPDGRQSPGCAPAARERSQGAGASFGRGLAQDGVPQGVSARLARPRSSLAFAGPWFTDARRSDSPLGVVKLLGSPLAAPRSCPATELA
jgi:hypothetical protein